MILNHFVTLPSDKCKIIYWPFRTSTADDVNPHIFEAFVSGESSTSANQTLDGSKAQVSKWVLIKLATDDP